MDSILEITQRDSTKISFRAMDIASIREYKDYCLISVKGDEDFHVFADYKEVMKSYKLATAALHTISAGRPTTKNTQDNRSE